MKTQRQAKKRRKEQGGAELGPHNNTGSLELVKRTGVEFLPRLAGSQLN